MFLPQTAHFQDDARARSSPQEREPQHVHATPNRQPTQAYQPANAGALCALRRPAPGTHTPFRVGGGGMTKTASSVEWSLQALKQACSQEYPESAMCVQSLDDSLDSAIRITYRISLRSSSLREPRHPPLKVFLEVLSLYIYIDMYAVSLSRCPCAERTSHERRHTHTPSIVVYETGCKA